MSAANAARTLNAAYDDRFVLGLGVSHQPLVKGLRGHDYASPLEEMRQYLEAMNAAPMFAPEGDHEFAKVIEMCIRDRSTFAPPSPRPNSRTASVPPTTTALPSPRLATPARSRRCV